MIIGPVLWLHTMVGAYGKAKPLVSWPGSKREEEKQSGDP
jgi:hypothetical protein